MLRIVRFAKAVDEFVADGCDSVSREQFEERLRICQDCPHLRGYHCSRCGCLVQLKAIGRAFDCPDQPPRWSRSAFPSTPTDRSGVVEYEQAPLYATVCPESRSNQRTTMPETPLPSFENPPVVETVLGVEFSPVPKWALPHFGLFWERIRADYPRVETQPPLASQIETFEQPRPPEKASIQLVPIIAGRCWYISDDDQHLLQLQHDRFLSNWRKGKSEHPYPRYDDVIKPRFIAEWARFVEFLKSESLECPDIVQCEVTYVNHIRKGDGWENIADWENVFVSLGIRREPQFLPVAESLRFETNYVIPERNGRLHVNAHHAIRVVDQGHVIAFTLTARGKPDSSSADDIVKWFDLGREWVVRGFADLTTEQMHQHWKRLT